MCIHISPYPLPLEPPSHPPYPTPLGSCKAQSCFPLAIYFTFGSVYKSMPLSHFVPAYPSPSLSPQVHSLRLCLYSCPAPRFFMTFFFFFLIPYIYVSVRYLFFSNLTSLCMTVSRCSHLTTNSSISFLFMAE